MRSGLRGPDLHPQSFFRSNIGSLKIVHNSEMEFLRNLIKLTPQQLRASPLPSPIPYNVLIRSFSSPVFPIEIFEEEIARHLDLQSLLALSRTCSHLSKNWSKFLQTLPGAEFASDLHLVKFPSLTELDLSRNALVTDQGCQFLTQLRSLNLTCNSHIHDQTLKNFTTLTDLDITMNAAITNASVGALSNLCSLRLGSAGTVSDAVLTKLPNLVSLAISSTYPVNNFQSTEISKLSQLTSLSLLFCPGGDYSVLSSLVNLQYLAVAELGGFSNVTLQALTNLVHLDLLHVQGVSDQGLAGMTHLTRLGLSHSGISDVALQPLVNLRALSIHDVRVCFVYYFSPASVSRTSSDAPVHPLALSGLTLCLLTPSVRSLLAASPTLRT